MMQRFKIGDRVVFARPHSHEAEDADWRESFVGVGAIGTVVYIFCDVYQYRVEYRAGNLVVRNAPLDRQLDPAPAIECDGRNA